MKRLLPDHVRPIALCEYWIKKTTGRQVYSGPFSGLKYVEKANGSAYYPKLLGTYEKEIQHSLSTLIHQKPDSILIIGAGEGYYAAGLAKLLPGSAIHAFEIDTTGQVLLQAMCSLNQIENISIYGEFHLAKHAALLDQNQLIIVDIEGDEEMLLGKDLFVHSKNNWMIEIHSFDLLQKLQMEAQLRFDIQWIPVAKRTLADFPSHFPMLLSGILHRYWLSLVQEWRNESLGWLILQPKEQIV